MATMPTRHPASRPARSTPLAGMPTTQPSGARLNLAFPQQPAIIHPNLSTLPLASILTRLHTFQTAIARYGSSAAQLYSITHNIANSAVTIATTPIKVISLALWVVSVRKSEGQRLRRLWDELRGKTPPANTSVGSPLIPGTAPIPMESSSAQAQLMAEEMREAMARRVVKRREKLARL
ncbi:hypothetical protein B0T16DRAFT_205507 [Cercophora newfieldiana]|uniref:Uncharacterized protein n=1 Tax=Cercophora newfieldiana TaxID=92897 RepID=A0AA39XVE6_9PEZI|nr:hypothetical protein B0T16DRAFT_205507 [Cercophora newfieldiana]